MTTAADQTTHADAQDAGNDGRTGTDTGQARPSAQLSPETKLQMLKDMMLIRRFEERTMQSYTQAHIGGFCHIYIGQEATAVGAVASMRPDDPLITAYRDHGHALARGMHPNHCMAEMYSKITGCAKGKGGSMHMFDKPHHMYGGHAIVGGQCPLAAGLGFGIQYNKEDKVCVCFLGDGALNQGAFHESMNLAAIWNLPIVFICENNKYSMGTHIARGTSMAHDLSAKAQAYGMRYAECNGMDVLETFDTVSSQAQKTRGSTGKLLGWEQDHGGPCFINAKTERYSGHSMSDPQKYRDKATYDKMKKEREIDPILRMVQHVVDHGLATEQEVEDLDQQAKQAAKDAVKFAQESEDTPMDELYTDVFANPFGPYKPGDPHPDFA